MTNLLLSVRIPRDQEITAEQAVTLVASLAKATQRPNIIKKALGFKPLHIALEITCLNQEIRFVVVGPSELHTFLEAQVQAAYPACTVEVLKDYLSEEIWPSNALFMQNLKLTSPSFYPLKTYKDFKEIDPLAALLGVMSKASPDDAMCIQIVMAPPGGSYVRGAVKSTNRRPSPISRSIQKAYRTKGIYCRISSSDQDYCQSTTSTLRASPISIYL
jgi:hypothetical protein